MAMKRRVGRALFVAQRRVKGGVAVYTIRKRDVFSDPLKTRYQDIQEHLFKEELPVCILMKNKKIARSAAVSTALWMAARNRNCTVEPRGKNMEITWASS